MIILIIKKQINNFFNQNKKEIISYGEYIRKLKVDVENNVIGTAFNRNQSRINFELSEIDNRKTRGRALEYD